MRCPPAFRRAILACGGIVGRRAARRYATVTRVTADMVAWARVGDLSGLGLSRESLRNWKQRVHGWARISTSFVASYRARSSTTRSTSARSCSPTAGTSTVTWTRLRAASAGSTSLHRPSASSIRERERHPVGQRPRERVTRCGRFGPATLMTISADSSSGQAFTQRWLDAPNSSGRAETARPRAPKRSVRARDRLSPAATPRSATPRTPRTRAAARGSPSRAPPRASSRPPRGSPCGSGARRPGP
jgi:hypothetical protein